MQKKMQPKNFSLLSLWSELSEDEQAAVSGGSGQTDPTPVWSIGFADVSRPSGSTSSTGQR
ncbi:hypothetical protein [Allocoleopsis sp.]|uniref:hypothetical protein n=1 Tax=Allocoleopsis sp. TaxID=3088169 RepID=UPI002FD28949